MVVRNTNTVAAPNGTVKRVRKAPGTNPSKICKAEGCSRQVRAAARYCITHGGGNTCEYPDCKTSARHGSTFCIAHGGGRRCQKPGCAKSAVGSTNFCKAHGGGRRCTYPNCFRAARPGQPQACMKHGGGKRCALPTCDRSAAARSNFCAEHLFIDGTDPAEKKKPGEKGKGKDAEKKKKQEHAMEDDIACRDLLRGRREPTFFATNITVPPLNVFLDDFRNYEDLGPPVLFTVDQSDMIYNTFDDEEEEEKKEDPLK
ncbi:hypothetical protein Pmar_PMAR023210 [Perkinsus marinus ATCC 50983]|uniref:WRKY19-like zinc finger domain-containing protein n=1 Tax=Perkinsus marinus (strain ATCC 50983 / TXsc) TaxID=423536 RepID=C5LJG9_PERM5|nr:hypothetical protein Pmar_PMAR023210 [Perkinsus marinus ATCC 50983]EER03098.1 hypothetical protein Pmar_PMAR023210 [Perkinsus marinus ATCC 50983]|eukprot:XP_002771282.1 hypothetical protein Pmar_PMAR023210 [Perkinsus marinus ATCC 50983]